MPTTDPHDADDDTGTPRWVKAFVVAAVVLVAVVVFVALAAGGHGPGRHSLPAATDAEAARVR